MLRGRQPEVRGRLGRARNARAAILVSAVVLFELRYGVARSNRPRENAEILQAFLAGGLAIVPFDGEDAEIAGDLRAALERAGRPIGHYDLLIAAHALRLGATLVTTNGREFARVPGLAWEDWAA